MSTIPRPKALLSQWPSLSTACELARSDAHWIDWFATQCDRVANPDFARLFTDHINIPGAEWHDFTHRIVAQNGTRPLGGIRFYGQDASRPFVELLAWSDTSPDWDLYRRIVAREWSVFAPKTLRLLCTDPVPPGSRTDLTLHAAPCHMMKPPHDPDLSLSQFESAQTAIELVHKVYTDLDHTAPQLRRNLQPASPGDLHQMWRDGALRAITRGESQIGLIAWADDTIDWLHGQVMIEEVIHPDHRGQGYAATAQSLLARDILAPNDHLIGTILAENTPSRRTANRAGRPEIARYVFLDLPHPPER